MAKLSVLIPACNEQFLQKTIDDLLENAEGDIEIIVYLDSYWPDPQLKDDNRIILIHHSERVGMRPAINAMVSIAKGEYLMKLDAHCLIDQGFDIKLMADCEDNWVVVPRRYSLDAENWKCKNKAPIDYMYLSYPDNPYDFGGTGLNGREWAEKNRDQSLKDNLIVDLMSAQGSCWLMHKEYFYELELMDDKNYGHFWNEMQEIGFKCWLSGGRLVRNKNTFYAHLHKGKQYGRGYFLSKDSLSQGATFTKKWMRFGEAWDKQTLPLSWLIEKFWPVPTWTEEGLKTLKEIEQTS